MNLAPRRFTLVASACAIALRGGAAHADVPERDVARALLVEEVRAINAGDAEAFAATFDDDGFAILPAAADEGGGRDAIALAAKRWLGAMGTVKVELVHARYGDEWFDAELVAPAATMRITGVLQARFDDGGTVPHYKVGALHVSEAVNDRTVLAAAAAGTLPALPAIADADAEISDSIGLARISRYARHVLDDPAVAVVGSAPSEHAVGRAAAAKLLSRWGALALSTRERRVGHDDDDVLLRWEVAHVEATFTLGRKTVVVAYRALVVVKEPWATAADHGATAQLVVAHFSVAPR